ncbi:hypothetical protein [Loktanella sp. S4079]|uniref:hypothetical protein n=1 Tax=Loktanella sp. S4079 TaxID=579483 RepID=UPI000AA4B269|nr:hypothetical protein [Loktanella sp. S4079]
MIFTSEKKSQKIRHALAEYVDAALTAARFLPRPLVHDRWLTGPQAFYGYGSFSRENADSLDLCRICFWRYGHNFYFQRYGGAFFVEFARVPLPFVVEDIDLFSDDPTIHEKVIEPDDVTLDRCAKFPAGALRGSPDMTTVQRHIFRYNHIWDDQQALNDLSQMVAGYLPQMEQWFDDNLDRPNAATLRTKV